MNLLARTAALSLLLLAPAEGARLLGESLPVGNDDPTYLLGTRAMNERRWNDAVASFDQVIQAHGSRADAALYWKAYALGKLGKPQLMQSTCEQLRTDYRTSTWNRDCGVLLMQTQIRAQVQTQIKGSVASFTPPHVAVNSLPGVPFPSDAGGAWMTDSRRDPDADLKMLAINSMLNRDPAQAVPILLGVLRSPAQPKPVKEHALFVLAQSRSSQAQAAMDEMIEGKGGTDVQRQAIQAAGLYGGRQRNELMEQVYRNTTDLAVKRAIISALFISQDAPHMVELAKREKNLDLKRDIVSELSLMPGKAATDYMMDLLK